MGASRRFRRHAARTSLNQRRKAYERQVREVQRASFIDQLHTCGDELSVRDAHAAGFVFAWLTRLATPEILELTA